MGRDVEFNYTAADKTGPASDSVVKRMTDTGKKVEKGLDANISKGLIGAVGKVSPKLAADLTGMFGQVAGKGGYILAAGVAAAAPLIGATVSAAVIGGVGLGGVIGGVALVSSDPRVKAAGRSLATNLTSDLRSDAGGFVEPVLRNIDKIGTRFDTLRPRIRRIFDNSAKFVDPLVDGLLDGVDGITRGMDRLIAKAGPVMDSLGRGFALVGESAGQAMAIIGDGSEDAASALDLVFRATGEVIVNVALLIRGLTELYGLMDGFGGTINRNVRGWLGLSDATDRVRGSGTFAAEATDGLRNSLAGLIPGLAQATVEAGENATEVRKLADASRNATNANRALYASETELAEGFAKASAAVRQNGRTIDVNSEKGRANRKILDQQAASIQANYDAFVAVNGVGPKSAAVAENLRSKFTALAQRAGYSAQQAQNLANKILGIPARRETRLVIETAAATAKANAIQAELNRIPRRIPVRVIVTRQGETLYGGGGGRQGSNFDANSTYRAAAADTVRRTGPPTPVSVASTVDVYLDGQPFYAVATRTARAREQRATWRQKVGRR